jgi:hypothetical protein
MFDEDTDLVACRGCSQLFEGRGKGKFIDEVTKLELAVECTFWARIH